MGLVEQFSELPLNWILWICVVLKIGLIVCLCGTDLCTSGEPTEYKRNEVEDNNQQQQYSVWLLLKDDNIKLTLYCIIDRNLHFWYTKKISPFWIPLVFRNSAVMVRHSVWKSQKRSHFHALFFKQTLSEFSRQKIKIVDYLFNAPLLILTHHILNYFVRINYSN